MRIRDPAHGTIHIEDDEVRLVDSPFFQRLRFVKQLGFGDMAFPGATHSRMSHCLGAMHVATRMFDAAFAKSRIPVSKDQLARMRKAVRVAAMCHDIGHMPLSHASEKVAPPWDRLGLPGWLKHDNALPGSKSAHEDYTAAVLLLSDFRRDLEATLSPYGLTPEAVVSLILGRAPESGSAFVLDGHDFGPMLRQFIAGELDADRLDYLTRDSLYTGVSYGRVDLDWLIENIMPIEVDGGAVQLGLSTAAIFAFEDFLLSRFHMFVSVYFHHTSVNFDAMLARYLTEAEGEFTIPTDMDGFASCDDVALFHALRQSKNPWARRIVRRQPYRLVVQATEMDKAYDVPLLAKLMEDAGVEFFVRESVGLLSKQRGLSSIPLQTVDLHAGTHTPIADYTPLYRRYAGALHFKRIYAAPEDAERAKAIVAAEVHSPRQMDFPLTVPRTRFF